VVRIKMHLDSSTVPRRFETAGAHREGWLHETFAEPLQFHDSREAFSNPGMSLKVEFDSNAR